MQSELGRYAYASVKSMLINNTVLCNVRDVRLLHTAVLGILLIKLGMLLRNSEKNIVLHTPHINDAIIKINYATKL